MEDKRNKNASMLYQDDLFTLDSIQKIEKSDEPKNFVCSLLENYFRDKYGILDIQSNILLSKAEFHVNNLSFLRETYPLYSEEVICQLLNQLALLLDLQEEDYNTNLQGFAGEEDEIKKYDKMPEPDLGYICKKKLKELKKGLQSLKLIPPDKQEMIIGNDSRVVQNNTEYNHADFHMTEKELQYLLDYLKTFYFSFIRLYYHFVNIDRITENKKIEVVINRPLLVPPLSVAVGQKVEKNIFDEQKDEDELLKNNEEEENEEQEEEENEDEEEKGAQKAETFQDIINRVNMNQETKKIIAERIEELHKDFDAKIYERQRKLDEKVKEIEDTAKPKKK